MKMNSKLIIPIAVVTGIIVTSIIAGAANNDEMKSGAPDTHKVVQVIMPPKVYKPGESVHTPYFNVVVSKAKVMDNMNDGIESKILANKDDSKYIVLYTTYSNTDVKQHAIYNGLLSVNYKGKTINYSHPQNVLIDGWSLIETIKPGETRKVSLVYKLPADAKGDVYYAPYPQDGSLKVQLLSL